MHVVHITIAIVVDSVVGGFSGIQPDIRREIRVG